MQSRIMRMACTKEKELTCKLRNDYGENHNEKLFKQQSIS